MLNRANYSRRFENGKQSELSLKVCDKLAMFWLVSREEDGERKRMTNRKLLHAIAAQWRSVIKKTKTKKKKHII